MKLLIASAEEMPGEYALVLMLATADEVRRAEWAERADARLVPQDAYDRMIVHLTDTDDD